MNNPNNEWNGNRVLIVQADDDGNLTSMQSLLPAGCQSVICRTESEAMACMHQTRFAFAIVDLNSEESVELVRNMRRADEELGILVVASPEASRRCTAVLLAGADDFVLRPVSSGELTTRLDALRVRAQVRPKSALTVGDLRIDLMSRKAYRGDRELPLTPTEFRILETLMQNKNNVVTRQMLCAALWDADAEGMTNVIEVHMNRLRNKIGRHESRQRIVTVRGKGYCLREHQASDDDAPQSHERRSSAGGIGCTHQTAVS